MTNEPRRTRLLASGLLVLTFIAGGLAGAASEGLLRAREPGQPAPTTSERARPERGRGPRSMLLEPTVLDQLRVSEQQRKAILSLLAQRDTATQKLWAEMEPRMNAIRAEVEPRFRAMMDASRKKIREQLNAEQLVKLDSMIAVRHAEREKARANGPEPRSPMDSGKTKTEHFE
jgi:hypothetical protein